MYPVVRNRVFIRSAITLSPIGQTVAGAFDTPTVATAEQVTLIEEPCRQDLCRLEGQICSIVYRVGTSEATKVLRSVNSD